MCVLCERQSWSNRSRPVISISFLFFFAFLFLFLFLKRHFKSQESTTGSSMPEEDVFSFHVSPTFQNILDWFSKFFHNNHQFTFAFERIRSQRWWLLFIPLPGKHYCCYFFIAIKVLLLRISLQFLLLYNDSNKGKSIIKAFPDTKLGSIRHSYFFGYIINKISSYPIETLHPLMGTLHFGFFASYTSF